MGGHSNGASCSPAVRTWISRSCRWPRPRPTCSVTQPPPPTCSAEVFACWPTRTVTSSDCSTTCARPPRTQPPTPMRSMRPSRTSGITPSGRPSTCAAGSCGGPRTAVTVDSRSGSASYWSGRRRPRDGIPGSAVDFLEEWADPATVTELPRAFARYDEGEVWDALAVTMDLFGDVARRSASALDLTYVPGPEQRARELVGELRSGR